MGRATEKNSRRINRELDQRRRTLHVVAGADQKIDHPGEFAEAASCYCVIVWVVEKVQVPSVLVQCF